MVDIRPEADLGLLKRAATSGVKRWRPSQNAFDATALTNLKLWLKADDLAVADGAAVASWPDASGIGNDAAQGTGANQPVLRLNGIGGKPAVEFDGTNDFLTGAISITGNYQLTAFMVMRYITQGGGGSMSFYRVGATDSNDPNLAIVNYNSDGNKSMFYKFNPGAYITNPANGTDMIYAGQTGWIGGGVKSQCWLNGNPAAQVVTDATNYNIEKYVIGSRMTPNASGFMKIRVAEIIVCHAVLSAAERNMVWAAMNAKYGITVSLE